MVVTIVTFQLDRQWTLDEAAAVFRSTAPRYLGRAGLLRKHYYLSEDGRRAGGIYCWRSRAAADACYTDDWRATVTAKYGAEPSIDYLQVPVSVDNINATIEAA